MKHKFTFFLILMSLTLLPFTKVSAQVYHPRASEETEDDEEYDSLKYCKIIKFWKTSASQGNKLAQYIVGSYYYNGQGIKKDFNEAFKWFSLSAAKGLPQSQYSLGLCYYNGQGTEQNYNQAVKWWLIAAKHGDIDAQFNLGLCYLYAKGLEKDLTKAHYWIERAARNGNNDALDFIDSNGFEEAEKPQEVT